MTPRIHAVGPKISVASQVVADIHRRRRARSGAWSGIAALRRRGRVVQPYKCGPDYIDPAFHAAAAGRASFNLDSWAQGRDRIDALLDAGNDADLCLAEGVMGLFDGVATAGAWGNGSTADIAAANCWPAGLGRASRGGAPVI